MTEKLDGMAISEMSLDDIDAAYGRGKGRMTPNQLMALQRRELKLSREQDRRLRRADRIRRRLARDNKRARRWERTVNREDARRRERREETSGATIG